MSRRRREGPVVANDDGTFALVLDEEERDVLRTFVAQFRDIVAGSRDDPRMKRLFPTAYAADAEANEEYRRFMDDELVTARIAMVDKVESVLDEGARLSDDELGSLMVTVNGLRLVLGTLLGVDQDEWEPDFDEDDGDDPRSSQWHLYNWFGWLLEWIVEARRPL
ncbi:MAG: DUF2017 family protein [Acidimicrobiales bacterium]